MIQTVERHGIAMRPLTIYSLRLALYMVYMGRVALLSVFAHVSSHIGKVLCLGKECGCAHCLIIAQLGFYLINTDANNLI